MRRVARGTSMRRAGRLLRRLPGYRYARRHLLPRVRSSSTARSLVRRVFDVDASHQAPMDVTAGTLLGGVGTERLPVVVVVMIALPGDRAGNVIGEVDGDVVGEAVDRVVDEVARQQVLTAGFRPVFVMDVPQLGSTRRYGYPVELLTPEADWPGPTGWDDYVRDRLASVIGTYRSSATLVVDPASGELGRTGELILGSLRPA